MEVLSESGARKGGVMNTSDRNYFVAGSLRMVALLVLVACSSLSSGCEKKGPVPVGVAAYNHTDETIFDFSINDAAVGRAIVPHAGGGVTCCLSLPRKWQQGQQLKVRWATNMKAPYEERLVPVPEYKEVDGFSIHFLRSGEVKVFVSRYRLGSSQYPFTGPEAGMREGENPVLW